MTNSASELDDLIRYWMNNYTFNYIHRSPPTNDKILKTIKALEQLKLLTEARTLSYQAPLT